MTRGDSIRSILAAAAVTLAAISLAPSAASAASLTPLGHLPGDPSSTANGVSADGLVVVGSSSSQAFRWTSDGGMVGLGDLPGGSFNSLAVGVSADGSVVVGRGSSTSFLEAFRWTSAGGMVGLGTLPGWTGSLAARVSADGSVVVGESIDVSFHGRAFRWTSGGGMVGLGTLPGRSGSYAGGVSADGSVVVGYGSDSILSDGGLAFRWTSGGGMVGLGTLPGASSSAAFAVSADGSVVVGASGSQAFRWTGTGGMVSLGDLPGGAFQPSARGVSADGSVIVGLTTNSFSGPGAFYWTADGGMRALWDVLLAHGIDPAADGWTKLGVASGISADGNTITGDGIRNGNQEAFIAVLPEPSVLGLFGLAVAALFRRHHQSRQRQAIRRACCDVLEGRRLLSFTPAVNYPVGAGPQDVVTADFNNDGHLDLATSNESTTGSSSVSVLLGNGHGAFGAAKNSTGGAYEGVLAAGDFNNDGKLDLVTASMYVVRVRLGNGDGTFQSPYSVLGTNATWADVGVADFNADQKMDLVITGFEMLSGTGYIGVLLGDGAGGFTASYWDNGWGASSLAIGDLNTDGTPDVVSCYGNSIVVWLGDGDGTLWPSYSTFIPGYLGSVGDFTGDGTPDLVTAGQTVDVLPGLGDGTFAAPISNPTNGNPAGTVAVADFNGDGKLDVVATDGANGTVEVLLGNGDGTLRYAGAFATGTSPFGIAAGDFNGDGRADVATANAGSNNVSVLLNDGIWATKMYIGPNGGNWSAAANWSPGGVPTASDHVLISGKSVNLAASAAVDELTLAGNASLAVAPNGNRVLRISAFSLSADSRLDLSDNDLIVDYSGASQLGAVQALVNSARHGGDWLGTGLTSSAARDNPTRNTTLGVMEATDYESIYGAGATFDGQAIDSTAVLVKYTYYGDADFNGKVNFDDYVRTDNGFNNHRTGWMNGDYNGDGLVNFDDYVLIDLAFNTQSGMLRR